MRLSRRGVAGRGRRRIRGPIRIWPRRGATIIVLCDRNVVVASTLIRHSSSSHLGLEAQLDLSVNCVERLGDNGGDVVDLILKTRRAAAEPNVTRRTLALTHPDDAVAGRSTTNTFVTFRTKDADVQLVPVDVGVDAVGTVRLVAVPAIDLVKVELYNNRVSRTIDLVLLEWVPVVLDETPQEFRETRIRVNLSVGPTIQRSVLKVFIDYLPRRHAAPRNSGGWGWSGSRRRTERQMRDGTVVP